MPDQDPPQARRTIGRERERTAIQLELTAALRGAGAVVLLAGEPGVGKTHLLNDAAVEAEHAGLVVLRGGASEAAGMPPYLPFLEALGDYIDRASLDRLREQIGPSAAILAAILPEIANRLGSAPASHALPPDQTRLRLYQAIGRLLAAIAEPGGLLLILDDLHWADPASLDLLLHVARHHARARLLILGSHRTGPEEQRPEFQQALAALDRLRALKTVAVAPLAADEIAALAAGIAGSPVDRTLARSLFSQSEGNPFFAEELLRDWLETGVAVHEHGRWQLTGSVDPATRPAGILRAVRPRIDRLDPAAVDLLQTAAIIGRTVDLELLAEVAGEPVETIEARLRQPLRAGLIRSDGETFAFSHDKIRETLYDDVTAARRRRVHGFIGRALEMRPHSDDGRRLSELAFHFGRSGDRARGASYARAAAEHAVRASAPVEAMAHYQTALDLLDSGEPARGDLLLGLGEAAGQAGEERRSAAALEAATAWFLGAGHDDKAAAAARRLGLAWWRQEATFQARASFEQALALPGAGAERVALLVDLASLLCLSFHELPAAAAYAREAVGLARRLDDRRLIASSNRTLGGVLTRSNELDAGIALLEAALALAVAEHDPVEAAECCASLAVAYFWRGSVRQSAEIARRRLEFARQCHDDYQLRHVHAWLAACAALLGNLDEADQALTVAQELTDQLASPEPGAYNTFARGAGAYVQGDYPRAEALLSEAISVFRAIGPNALVWYLGFLGLTFAAQGKLTDARACVNEMELLLAPLPKRAMVAAEPLAQLAALSLALDDRDDFAKRHADLLPFRGEFHDFLIDRLLGELELRQGEFAAARVHLDSAETMARAEGLQWDLARILEARADLALAGGQRDRRETANALLTEALAIIDRIGAEPEARRLRQRLSRSEAEPKPPPLPAGLSRREVEVLQLAATGKTNREIAAALSLSEKTIENHLGSIYAKTGADNRAAATAFAVRHGLA
jgi:DNA-binding CsgD family transcriptional regulator